MEERTIRGAIDTVHVVFKTHLDIGFTDMACNVVAKYKNEFIPKALSLAERLAGEEGASFVWTTGSWLIERYLADAGDAERERMERAIRDGHIAWHGLPFTTHTELLDASLFRYGLSIARRLDARFGKRTITAKMTDVPGHTRSIVTHMAASGLQYLHLGVNPASKVPGVPPLFVWRAEDGAEIIVNYANNYGNTMHIPGLRDALHFAHTGDNNGPPSAEDVREQFTQLAKAYPGAAIRASTMDAFAVKLLAHKPSLPVVTEEIGDTWIHGAASDPIKIARFREMQRMRSRWIEAGRMEEDSEEYRSFSEGLLLVAEHTWGMDEKKFLGDYKHYGSKAFAEARERDSVAGDAIPAKYSYIGAFAMDAEDRMSGQQFQRVGANGRSYRVFERSWQEQRDYLNQAINALGGDKRDEMNAALKRLIPDARRIGKAPIRPHIPHSLGVFAVAFSDDGSIASLVDRNGKEWADRERRIGMFVYEAFSVENYNEWFEDYVENTAVTHGWSDADFGKPGMENVEPKPRHRLFAPMLVSMVCETGDEADLVSVSLRMPAEAVEDLGAPREVRIDYSFRKDEPQIGISLSWSGKQANRLPEAIWFSITPTTDNVNRWRMDKMGQPVSPLDVVRSGNRNLHALGEGLFYQAADGEASVRTYDAPIVAPGARRLLKFDNTFASLEDGFHFLLYNNAWGTNFPMWFEEDCFFRFELAVRSY
ncbi:DUF5054 domain-containing protein [Paenibacillus sp. GCM10027626]|uniref:DUF5054 domain-containing protein n=1 Tax=Paenibacillus sp. GCM10027626 TaxID=3273411 RepID=UPI003626E80C